MNEKNRRFAGCPKKNCLPEANLGCQMACQLDVNSPESETNQSRDHFGGLLQERWLSGRKRRFAKSVNWETGSAGSNPVRSV